MFWKYFKWNTLVLHNVPFHNLGKEQSVVLFNYETKIRGRQNFKRPSQNLVQNKSSVLINTSYKDLRKYRKQASDIKEIKLQWNQKMQDLENDLLDKQEVTVLTSEKRKINTYLFLRSRDFLGPLLFSDYIDLFQSSTGEPEINQRLYSVVKFIKY